MKTQQESILEKQIAYCVYVGVCMGRQAQSSGSALMYDGCLVSDDEYAIRVAAEVMKQKGNSDANDS